MAEILASRGPSVEATLRPVASWPEALKGAIRSGAELCRQLQLPPELASDEAESDFPVFAPLEYVRRMKLGDAQDPLLRQVLGVPQETSDPLSGQRDAVGDLAAVRAPGLLHKYDRRVLMITSGVCAVHCRYCFRRHFPYQTAPKGRAGWQQSLEIIAADPSIDEVILSGGDPLTLADEPLRSLVADIQDIPTIRRIRLHTLVPVVIPQRVCEPLLAWVRQSRLPIYFVLHFNHANEIDAAVAKAVDQLRRAGATLLNQAVLLRGVNDSVAAQSELCLRLVDLQILPYYLHQLDRVQGALHFEVSDERALAIAQALPAHLPGYAVPKLVRETAGEPSKTLLT
ncbi:MAG: EF-P beta-lysylation protein EpmB, partial [Planctomycetales bacterium]|nr:EF-P beta-lysylation protein EpmB [Planctomycetales bacterium]